MVQGADFAMIHTADQWQRASHENTALLVQGGVVQLAWRAEYPPDVSSGSPQQAAGLAFDPWCRLYRSLPEDGRLERLLWADTDSRNVEPLNLFTSDVRQPGEFHLTGEVPTAPDKPRGLAIDDDGRLFIAESGRYRILIYDLMSRRLLRRVVIVHGGVLKRPIDLATDGKRIYALLEGETSVIATLDARTGPCFLSLPKGVTAPDRIEVAPTGEIYLLDEVRSSSARVIPLKHPDRVIEAHDATDLAFLEDNVLVIARLPGQRFLRIRISSESHSDLPQMNAPGYDGRGIVSTPDGRIGFWSTKGFATATLARVLYEPRGRVTSYRLDSGEYQTQWGRLFLDACIPKGTDVKVFCLVRDELLENAVAMTRNPPENIREMDIHRPDLSPPMPPLSLVENPVTLQKLHRRACGLEIPWARRPSNDKFETYEAPVIGGPGRYLWVVIELKGSSRVTPKIRSLRAEYPSHDLLRRLPRIYSRDEAIAGFLRRYIGITESNLRDIDLRATFRHVLLDPHATPVESLPWLAGFIGMVLDERWSERAKRELIEHGVWLFRFRGTVMGLKRFIEIYLNRQVTIIEHFKVRGLGGAIVGEGDVRTSTAVVGAGFRVGGKLGETEQVSIDEPSVQDAFTTHAHRFSLVLPLSLDMEQREVIEHILDVHRPAHTLYDICSVDTGMRVGMSLYVELTTRLGRSSGFGQLQVGGSVLGRSDILGYPAVGTRIGGSVLGGDSRVG